MKIVTLNIWAGILKEALLEFFKENQDIDIFCLQEVMQDGTERTNWDNRQERNIFEKICDVLPNHHAYYRPAENNEWGLASFVKKSIVIEEEGEEFVYRYKDAMGEGLDATLLGKNLQYLKLSGKDITIINFHGLWTGEGKEDTENECFSQEI